MTSDVTINDIPVLSGDLFVPRVGNWTSCLYVDTEIPPAGLCKISWLGQLYSGHVIHAGESETLTRVLVGGGVGNLYKSVKAKQYDQIYPIKVPLEEILQAVGERLSTSSTPQLLSKPMKAWVRTEDDASNLLSLLADITGAIWRVLPDGSVFFGEDTWQEFAPFDHVLLAENYENDTLELSVESPGILPGQSYMGKKVGAVRYKLYESESCATVYLQNLTSPSTDPIKAGIERIVKEVMRGEAYRLTYTGTVVNQAASGALGIKIDDTTKIPYLSNVPMRVPIPGCKLVPTPGTRVQVSFERGEPTGYVTGLYEIGTGAKGAARVGDTVNIDTNLANWISQVTTAINALSSGAVTAVPTIAGKITTGSAELLLK